MRVPHAARQLHKQLQDRYKNPTMTATGDPDGFGVKRSVEFDKTSSNFLAKIVDHLDDERIVGSSVKKGVLTLTFSDGNIADHRDPFQLDAAATIASAAKEEPAEDEPTGDSEES